MLFRSSVSSRLPPLGTPVVSIPTPPANTPDESQPPSPVIPGILRNSRATASPPPQSTVVVEKSMQDLLSLMQDLSAYSNQFLEMVCDKLKEYKEICNAAYRSAWEGVSMWGGVC